MQEYAIFTDACADLGMALARKFNIKILSMEYTIGKKNCSTAAGEKEMKAAEFYQKMKKGSCVFAHELREEDMESSFSEELQQGKDILYITASSQMTSARYRAEIVFNRLRKHYPERQMVAADSHLISIGEGILVWQAARLRNAGKTLSETERWIAENWMRVHIWYLVGDRRYLERSGSLSRAAALSKLKHQIQSPLDWDSHETISDRSEKLLEITAELEQGAVTAEDDTVFLAQADCLQDCMSISGRLSEYCGIKNVCLSEIGPIVGSHTGPGTVAAAYLCRQPEGGDEINDV